MSERSQKDEMVGNKNLISNKNGLQRRSKGTEDNGSISQSALQIFAKLVTNSGLAVQTLQPMNLRIYCGI